MGWRSGLMLASAACVLLSLGPTVARAAPSDDQGNTLGHLAVGAPLVRSMTVSISTFTYGACRTDAGARSGAAMRNPNGVCRSPRITVTVGTLASHVVVKSTDLLPESNPTGTPWTLCDPGVTGSCKGAGRAPGVDQAAMSLGSPATVGTSAAQSLVNQSACDRVITPACGLAAPGARAVEVLSLVGPEVSSDPAVSRSHLVTWTVVP